jgi:carbamoyl-phosphate synthase large subunit
MYGTYLGKKPRRVLVLGSGALQIGQAGEFEELADRIYLVAITTEFAEQIIVKEEVDAILLSFGGQTALNCGLALHDSGVLGKYGIQVLGTPVESIRDTEDRELFVQRLSAIEVSTARSKACRSDKEALTAAREIGLPVMLRGAFALGGKGSGVVESESDLDAAVERAFSGGAQQVLVEEYLEGWKEIEYEVVRDGRDNCITVCNMENFDPMGIHTGESIVVAPSQTLNDEEYQLLRSISIRTVRHLGIVGECNIQFALNPGKLEYRVIEVNARLSRSSALASKATGYPLAYVAAKLAIGYTLADIPNSITRRTTAFFEPALDYLVCKVPRWDLTKFQGASIRIGSEMKSVGEVMAIGRTFPEVIQKALRMLDIAVRGLDPDAFEFDDLRHELKRASSLRIFAIAQALRDGMPVDEIHALTRIDRWFLRAMEPIVAMHRHLQQARFPLPEKTLREAKAIGFSDQAIAILLNTAPETIREARKRHRIEPQIAQIDTLAAEFPADTNYLYTTYHASATDVPPSWRKKIMVLGSGPYRIGASVEFDWCCVSAVQAASALGYETIMVNYNPETVSTDYDVCDRLIFDEVSLETIFLRPFWICTRRNARMVLSSAWAVRFPIILLCAYIERA